MVSTTQSSKMKVTPVVEVSSSTMGIDRPVTSATLGKRNRAPFNVSSDEDGSDMGHDSDVIEPDPNYELPQASNSRKRGQKRPKTDTPLRSTRGTKPNTAPLIRRRNRVQCDAKVLYDQLDAQDTKIDGLEQTAKELKDRFKDSEARKRDYYHGRARRSKDATELKARLKIANDTCTELKQRIHEKDTAIQELQAASLQKLGKADRETDLDPLVTSKISKLFRSTKNWSTTYSVREWTTLDRMARDLTFKYLEASELPVLISDDCRMALQRGLLRPKVIVNALLNGMLVQMMLTDPFSTVAAYKSARIDQAMALTLRDIYAAAHGRPIDAARFRCTTALSLLQNDCRLDDFEASKAVRDKTEAFCLEACSSTLKVVQHLLAAEESERSSYEAGLLDIVRSFIGVGLRINCQYPHVTFDFQERLSSESFITGSEFLQAHPGMQLKDDGDEYDDGRTAEEAGVAGRAPDLIVEPLIRRSGDERGEVWDCKRVLQPALVWICNPAQIRKSNTSPSVHPRSPLQQSRNGKTTPKASGDSQKANSPTQRTRRIDATAALTSNDSRRHNAEPRRADVSTTTASQEGPGQSNAITSRRKNEKEPATARFSTKIEPDSELMQPQNQRRKTTTSGSRASDVDHTPETKSDAPHQRFSDGGNSEELQSSGHIDGEANRSRSAVTNSIERPTSAQQHDHYLRHSNFIPKDGSGKDRPAADMHQRRDDDRTTEDADADRVREIQTPELNPKKRKI